MAHHVFETYGAQLRGVDVDEHGLVTDQLGDGAQLVFVTPTHQFPLGSFLKPARRRELLDWAARWGVWVIEDDYDSEYRHSVRPEPALQSLDRHGRVIHVGTFSKTLSPQLRIGYMVLPARLVKPFSAAKRMADRHSPSGPQRALAWLLETGLYSRHMRRIRRLQLARQAALLSALKSHLGDRIKVQGAASGLHVVVWFPALPSRHEPALVDAARALGVGVYPIGPLYQTPTRTQADSEGVTGLVLGYALLDRENIEEGVKRIALALAGCRTERTGGEFCSS